MSIHTMEEATEGLTPHEIWIRRAVYHHARRILIDPSTSYTFNPRGYLERIEFGLGGTRYVLMHNGDNGVVGDMLYLMFDEAARCVAFEEIQDAKEKMPRFVPILDVAEKLVLDRTTRIRDLEFLLADMKRQRDMYQELYESLKVGNHDSL